MIFGSTRALRIAHLIPPRGLSSEYSLQAPGPKGGCSRRNNVAGEIVIYEGVAVSLKAVEFPGSDTTTFIDDDGLIKSLCRNDVIADFRPFRSVGRGDQFSSMCAKNLPPTTCIPIVTWGINSKPIAESDSRMYVLLTEANIPPCQGRTPNSQRFGLIKAHGHAHLWPRNHSFVLSHSAPGPDRLQNLRCCASAYQADHSN